MCKELFYPLLFNIVMSELQLEPIISTFTYADDIGLVTAWVSLQYLCAALRQYLYKSNVWWTSITPTVNIDEPSIPLFSAVPNTIIFLQIQSKSIPILSQAKDLRVTYNQKLRWELHLNKISGKVSRPLAVFQRF